MNHSTDCYQSRTTKDDKEEILIYIIQSVLDMVHTLLETIYYKDNIKNKSFVSHHLNLS